MHASRAVAALVAALVAVGLAACGSPVPAPSPAPGPPPGAILGTERVGWDQVAANSGELDTFRWVAYVDGARVEIADVSCDHSYGSSGYPCSAPLPPLTPGMHILELAAYVVVDGETLESSRSERLTVTVAAARNLPAVPPAQPPVSSWNGTTVPVNGGALRLDVVADGLRQPNDIAFAPDGRLFVAEAGGQVRIVVNGVIDRTPALVVDNVAVDAGGLLGLAVDPAFGENARLYVVYVARAADGTPSFVLARGRVLPGSTAAPAVLLDAVPARTPAAAALRAGADGTLYLALDDGGDPRAAGDLASSGGKVLRLNTDGTTPRDQAAFSPAYAMPEMAPRAMALDPSAGTLWVADAGAGADGAGRLRAIVRRADGGVHGVTMAEYALPAGTPPSSLTLAGATLGPAFAHNLLLASAGGRHLLRLWIDPGDPSRVIGSERLLQDVAGSLRVVATGPDGVTYFATATAIGRLTIVP